MRHSNLTRRLQILSRRRKTGSIIRVIGSILPSCIFTPPCHIYIPNLAQLGHNQWGFLPQYSTGLTLKENLNPPTENEVEDGVIAAFEIDSDNISSVSGDLEDEDDASSSPEGWTQEQRIINFNPTLNLT